MDDFNDQESTLEPIAKLLPNNSNRNGPFSNIDTAKIIIQDNSSSNNFKDSEQKN